LETDEKLRAPEAPGAIGHRDDVPVVTEDHVDIEPVLDLLEASVTAEIAA